VNDFQELVRVNLVSAFSGGQPPCDTSRRQGNNWFGAMPCRRPTRLTVMLGSEVSSVKEINRKGYAIQGGMIT
jgi:hypothetical protein